MWMQQHEGWNQCLQGWNNKGRIVATVGVHQHKQATKNTIYKDVITMFMVVLTEEKHG